MVHATFHLPGVRNRYRIAVAADLHLPCFYSNPPQIVELLNKIRPDALILAGDVVHREGSEDLVSVFKEVRVADKFAVLGNWEYFGGIDLERLKAAYRSANIQLLVNQTALLHQLPIIGLDDYLFGKPDYTLVERSTDDKKIARLVISHCPGHFNKICAAAGSPLLVISGHTHGGQIAPLGKAIMLPEGSGSRAYGRYRESEHELFVTRGIGTSGFPLRIGAPPEIAVLDIRGGQSPKTIHHTLKP